LKRYLKDGILFLDLKRWEYSHFPDQSLAYFIFHKYLIFKHLLAITHHEAHIHAFYEALAIYSFSGPIIRSEALSVIIAISLAHYYFTSYSFVGPNLWHIHGANYLSLAYFPLFGA